MAIRLKTEREVARLKAPGKHSLGGNLYLQIGTSGSRSWVGRMTDHVGARRDIGLGSCRTFTLGEAREKILDARKAVARGADPVAALNPRPMPTFEELARKVHAERKVTFKNAKHCAQWLSTLETYVFPKIGRTPIDKVTSAAVLDLLRPIWLSKPETARRVLQRVATVVSYAVPEGYRDSELATRGINSALPPQKRKVRHHPAVAVDDAPRVYGHIASLDSMSSRALRFAFLTAARSAEAREACWSEVDLDNRAWTVPAHRMKAGLEHRVPLSPEAVIFLKTLPRIENEHDLLFPNGRGNPLSDSALSKTFKQAAPGFTVHGWRSTFKDWALEMTDFRDEISECALAHVNSDKTRAAYARSDLFEKRRELMNAWSGYLSGD